MTPFSVAFGVSLAHAVVQATPDFSTVVLISAFALFVAHVVSMWYAGDAMSSPSLMASLSSQSDGLTLAPASGRGPRVGWARRFMRYLGLPELWSRKYATSSRSKSHPLLITGAATALHPTLLLMSLRLIGPAHCLLGASTAAPVLILFFCMVSGRHVDKRRLVRFGVAALAVAWLIAYDLAGGHAPGEKVALVRSKVLESKAGHAMKEKWNSLASDMRSRHGQHLRRASSNVDTVRYTTLSEVHSRNSKPEGDGAMPESGADVAPIVGVSHGSGRRLLTSLAPRAASETRPSMAELMAGDVDTSNPAEFRVQNGQAPTSGGRRRIQALASDLDDSLQRVLDSAAPPNTVSDPRSLHGEEQAASDLSLSPGDSVAKSRDSVELAHNSLLVSEESADHVPAEDPAPSRQKQGMETDMTRTGEDPDPVEDSDIPFLAGAIGVLLSTLSFACGTFSLEAQHHVGAAVGNPWVGRALVSGAAIAIVMPLAAVDVLLTLFFRSMDAPRFDRVVSVETAAFSLCFIIVPHQYHQAYVSGGRAWLSRSPSTKPTPSLGRRESKGSEPAVPALDDLLAAVLTALSKPSEFAVQRMALIVAYPIVSVGMSKLGYTQEPMSLCLWLAAMVSLMATDSADTAGTSRKRHRGASRAGPGGASMGYSRTGSLPYSSLTLRARRTSDRRLSFLLEPIGHMSDFFHQARNHKASWQVLNFLILQCCMVILESSYAFATDSVGLVSISADNLFCCIALAAGLFAIRATASQKRPNQHSYGLVRLESLCGFANGILLIVVALLVLLEAIDRVVNPEYIDATHIFAVCLFGIGGNAFGLVFFPPESRRENHNVHGIYLHIWANTLAYVGICTSTMILSINPGWLFAELIVGMFVAGVIVASAIPLLRRSGRLLMNLPAVEIQPEIVAVAERLRQIDGVRDVEDLRVWHMAPTSVYASMCLIVDPYPGAKNTLPVAATPGRYDTVAHPVHDTDSPETDSPEATSADASELCRRRVEEDILFRARSLLFSIGVPASQATIELAESSKYNRLPESTGMVPDVRPSIQESARFTGNTQRLSRSSSHGGGIELKHIVTA